MKANQLNVSHYLFDFDGTLVNSMPYFAMGMLEIIDKYDVDYPEDLIKIITPMGVIRTCDYFVKLGVKKTQQELISETYNKLLPVYKNVIILKDGVKEKLKELKNKGKSLSVLTASPHVWVDDCLKRNGVYDLFDFVWSGDDFPIGKNNPEIYKLCAKKLNVDIDNIAFLDDNINAISSAVKSGIKTIGVFDNSSKEDKNKFIEIADCYINGFNEL